MLNIKTTIITEKEPAPVREEDDGDQRTMVGMLPAIKRPTAQEPAPLLPVSGGETPASMNLVTSCGNAMFEVLDCLKNRAKAGDREAISDACDVAKEISTLMRIQLDAIRLMKSFK